MRKSLLFLAASAVAASASSTVAAPVQRCYQLSPATDVLRLILDDQVKGHQRVYGSWVGGSSYSLGVSGAYEVDVDGVSKALSITTGNGYGGGNQICGLRGAVDGNWTFQCTGGTSGNFPNSGGPMTQVSCHDSGAIHSDKGPALKQ